MKFPFFASFILFIILLRLRLGRVLRTENKNDDAFWKRESEANSVRKKSLEDLPYIQIDFEALPMDVFSDNPEIARIKEQLKSLAKEKIVCLSGQSNTDLKLQYGTANITVLSEYDQNFTTLICLLQDWAKTLLADSDKSSVEASAKEAAIQILSYAISIESDIYHSYEMLAELYLERGEMGKIGQLKENASSLRSSSKDRILRMLDGMDVSSLL